MGPIGPVVAEEGTVAKFVFGDDKAIGGDAAVGDGDLELVWDFGEISERNLQAFILMLGMSIPLSPALTEDTRHAFCAFLCDKVQANCFCCFIRNRQIYHSISVNMICGIVEIEIEGVVLDVDVGLLGEIHLKNQPQKETIICLFGFSFFTG